MFMPVSTLLHVSGHTLVGDADGTTFIFLFLPPSQLLQSMWAVSCQLACLWPSSPHTHCLSHAYRVPYGMHVCDNVCLCLYSFFISLMCIVIPSLCVVSPHSLHSSPLRLFSFCPIIFKVALYCIPKCIPLRCTAFNPSSSCVWTDYVHIILYMLCQLYCKSIIENCLHA